MSVTKTNTIDLKTARIRQATIDFITIDPLGSFRGVMNAAAQAILPAPQLKDTTIVTDAADGQEHQAYSGSVWNSTNDWHPMDETDLPSDQHHFENHDHDIFGNGADGPATLDGSTAFSWASVLNLLTANQSSFESGTTGWAARNGSSSLAQDTSRAYDATACLKVTNSSGGVADVGAITPTGTSGIPVVVGTTYTASFYGSPSTTASNCNLQVNIVWYNSSGTLLSTSSSATITEAAALWRRASVSAAAPANAAFAAVEVVIKAAGAGAAHYADAVMFEAASSASTWTIGGGYRLSRDVFFTDLTVNSGVSLLTNGYRIFGSGTLTNNGTIQNNGLSGFMGSGAAGGPGMTVGPGGTGGNGRTTSASPTNGGDVTPSLGGDGGNGANSGGTGGNTTPPVGGSAILTTPDVAINGFVWVAASSSVGILSGGGGGGGGGGSALGAGDTGGGGGGGGGVVLICFGAIVNNGTISADGGRGGNAVSSTGATVGGGGGGGGGEVRLIYNTMTGSGTVTKAAGAAGSGAGSGAVGSVGTAGVYLQAQTPQQVVYAYQIV
jgi:Carbohydrate binding domain